MPISHRFGKRIPLPSTRQIRHDLILLWAADDLRKTEARAIVSPETVIKSPEGGRLA
jgi:hypothetical protein